jgi:hypothetical protein
MTRVVKKKGSRTDERILNLKANKEHRRCRR